MPYTDIFNFFQNPNRPAGAYTAEDLAKMFGFTTSRDEISKLFQDAITAGQEVNKELYDLAATRFYNNLAAQMDAIQQQAQRATAESVVNNASQGVAAANMLSLLLGASQQGVEAATEVLDENFATARQAYADRVRAEKEAAQYYNELAAIMAGISNTYDANDAMKLAALLSQPNTYTGGSTTVGVGGGGGYTYQPTIPAPPTNTPSNDDKLTKEDWDAMSGMQQFLTSLTNWWRVPDEVKNAPVGYPILGSDVLGNNVNNPERFKEATQIKDVALTLPKTPSTELKYPIIGYTAAGMPIINSERFKQATTIGKAPTAIYDNKSVDKSTLSYNTSNRLNPFITNKANTSSTKTTANKTTAAENTANKNALTKTIAAQKAAQAAQQAAAKRALERAKAAIAAANQKKASSVGSGLSNGGQWLAPMLPQKPTITPPSTEPWRPGGRFPIDPITGKPNTGWDSVLPPLNNRNK